MLAEKQREIASKGGKASHREGSAHEFTSEEGRLAGRKGGLAVSSDRAHMSEIGRKGGLARQRRRMQLQQQPAPTVATMSVATSA